MSQNQLSAIVIGTTRKFATLYSPAHPQLLVRLHEKHKQLTVGDEVLIEPEKDEFVISEIRERRNCLSRVYFDKRKDLVANVDRLFVVTAAGALYNPLFIDRVLVSAAYEGIECHLIVNKVDAEVGSLPDIERDYAQAEIPITFCSAKQHQGLEPLQRIMEDPSVSLTAFCGMSGVGKSTLLNRLCPGATQATGDVSDKTGQGKQTTSQASGHAQVRADGTTLIIVDLPGIQNFGLSDFNVQRIADGFPEFVAARTECEYRNCSHTVETSCAIQSATEAGDIPASRYRSYLHMLEEIKR